MSNQRFCLCGCGESVKNKWVRGHHSRVNNISKRPDIREKRRKQMQDWHDSGEWQPWNKGVSDERTKKNGRAVAASRGEVWRKNAANALRKNRKTFSGPDHGQWQGGTSPLYALLRADHRLYKEWKKPILERDGFSCTQCSYTKQLEIHHDKEQMSDIVKLFVKKTDLERSWKEKKKVVDNVVQYHIDQQVSGVTLCRDCHKDRHNSHNF